MSETLGCPEDHTSTALTWGAGLMVAADQGCEFYSWPGPYRTSIRALGTQPLRFFAAALVILAAFDFGIPSLRKASYWSLPLAPPFIEFIFFPGMYSTVRRVYSGDMWMPSDQMQSHIDGGCCLGKYLDGPDGPHFWDEDCQIKFAPQAWLDRPAISRVVT